MKQTRKLLLLAALLAFAPIAYACWQSTTTTCTEEFDTCPRPTFAPCGGGFTGTFLLTYKAWMQGEQPTGWTSHLDIDEDFGTCNCVYQWWNGVSYQSGVCKQIVENTAIPDGTNNCVQ